MNEQELKELIRQMIGEEDTAAIVSFFKLDDESFTTIAPVMLNEIKKVYASPDISSEFIKLFRGMGSNINDLMEFKANLTEQICNTYKLSAVKRDFVTAVFDEMIDIIIESNQIYTQVISIPIERLSEKIKMPTYAHATDAGMDVYSPADYTIHPGETKLIPLGFKVAVPEGYMLNVYPKSGLSLKSKMRIANSVGVIDSGYRDEVGVIIDNIANPIEDIDNNNTIEYGLDMHITEGQKIAQLILQPVPKICFDEVTSIDVIAGDRGGGFGSTGKF